ncbi:MAG: flagellar hook-length control protein FliK [Candidatus Margulisbacteria bacterium]|jgi:flagellar hook-length control protein FliK|nr:flagellar hook-length control protein FliK [Candidatus Margulisiibacteriota bacterium]
MEINLAVLKTQTRTELTHASAGAAVNENFALILDQAVGAAQEKTTAAEQAQAEKTEPPLLPRQESKTLLQEFAAILTNTATPDILAPKTTKKTENKLDSAEPEITKSEPAEKTEEPRAAPANLLQTQLEKVVDKVNYRGASVEQIDLPAKTPLAAPLAPAVPFAEIYAELMKAIQAKKDGQILKFKFALEPENLGKLDIYIFAESKKLHLAFASGAETRRLLENAQPELKDLLEQYGFSLADLDFSGYSGQRHEQLEREFLVAEAEKNDFGVLKTLPQNVIIKEIYALMRDVLVNYLA